MKKYLIIIFILTICLFLVHKNNGKEEREEKEEFRGVFLSYIELNKYMNDLDNIDLIINNISKYKFNTLIVQVRAFSDSIYKSNLFPFSTYCNNTDILKIIINKCKKKSIKVIAWINPYRISFSSNINKIQTSNPAYKFINTDHIKILDNGIYYNPSSNKVENLILKGVEEILNNYNVEGILYDDYFYPSSDIDVDNYNSYLESNNYISLEEYHLNVVNSLIKKTKNIINKYNRKLFVSPDANMENNYSKNYADVKKWINNNYIDYIMPQIYYGFYNETKPFINVLDEWEALVKGTNVKLLVALALYKSGQIDPYAKSGSNEWLNNTDILMRQILLSRVRNNYAGIAIYRYDYLVNNNTASTVKEVENIKKILN